jgi:peptide/nickel transport system permease protein
MATLSLDTIKVKKVTPTKLRWFLHNPKSVASVGYLIFLAIIGALAPWMTPYNPNDIELSNIMAAPSAAHWLGTDDLGRDVVSRLMAAAGPSMFASFLAVSIGMSLGVPIGLVAGYAGGVVDAVISRVLDAMLSFPAIVFAVGVVGVLGPGLVHGMLAVGILMLPGFARLVRATTLVVKQELYVDAIRAFGATPLRIIARHVLPNAVQSAIVNAGLLLAVALLAESSLSYLGLGVQPPASSWGGMLARAYNYMEVAPEQMYAPGFAILVTALAFNGLGETVRLALDPRGPKR